MGPNDLLSRLHDQPFKPFRIKLSNSTVIDVLDPGSVIVGETSAVVPTQWESTDLGYRFARQWKTIALSHIVEFSDLESKQERRRRA